MEYAAIHFRRLGGIDAGGTATEDDPAGTEGQDLAHRDGVGDDLRIDMGLANATGDDLGVLGAKIENQNPFVDSAGTR